MGSLQNPPASLVSSSKLITRVTNYQTVASLWESAKGYYAWSKEASPIVNYVETSLEGGLHKSLNWITPKVEPVLKSQAFENYAKPLLTTVDDFGVKQLENVEGRVDKFNQVYKQSKQNLEKRVETIKDTTRATLEGVNHAVIEPVDSYLSHSVLGAPFNLALNVTEKVVEKYVVKESEKEQENKNANDIGPIFRTTRLSKKLQREAFEKLKTLSLRTPEKIHAMTYTVDLIQYAATTLDNGVVKISKKMNQGVQEISNGAKYVYDAPKKILSKENFEKLNKYTKDAFHAVTLAADNISKQIPAPITNRVQQTYLTLKDTATHNLNGEEVDFALFSNLVGKSSDLLKSVSGTISQYVAKGEQVPTQLLHTAKENLLGVLDLLGVVQKHAASEKAEGKALKENGSTNGIHALDSSDRAATPL